MNLKEKLSEYLFNLETAQLLQSLGRTREQVVVEMTSLNFSESLLQFQSSSKHLYDSVMLRLRLYSESNFSEVQVRQSLSVLNNSYVTSLLDYLYSSQTTATNTTIVTAPVVTAPVVTSPVVTAPVVTAPVVTAPVVTAPVVTAPVTQSNEVEESEEEDIVESDEDDSNPFESFFESCVEQTNEETDIVKASDFYQAFTAWWEDQYEENVPDKKELKTFLNERLGKSKKSTWTKVVLSN